MSDVEPGRSLLIEEEDESALLALSEAPAVRADDPDSDGDFEPFVDGREDEFALTADEVAGQAAE